jgi:hypothetical protein
MANTPLPAKGAVFPQLSVGPTGNRANSLVFPVLYRSPRTRHVRTTYIQYCISNTTPGIIGFWPVDMPRTSTFHIFSTNRLVGPQSVNYAFIYKRSVLSISYLMGAGVVFVPSQSRGHPGDLPDIHSTHRGSVSLGPCHDDPSLPPRARTLHHWRLLSNVSSCRFGVLSSWFVPECRGVTSKKAYPLEHLTCICQQRESYRAGPIAARSQGQKHRRQGEGKGQSHAGLTGVQNPKFRQLEILRDLGDFCECCGVEILPP